VSVVMMDCWYGYHLTIYYYIDNISTITRYQPSSLLFYRVSPKGGEAVVINKRTQRQRSEAVVA
jgi:hypothetical protein